MVINKDELMDDLRDYVQAVAQYTINQNNDTQGWGVSDREVVVAEAALELHLVKLLAAANRGEGATWCG